MIGDAPTISDEDLKRILTEVRQDRDIPEPDRVEVVAMTDSTGEDALLMTVFFGESVTPNEAGRNRVEPLIKRCRDLVRERDEWGRLVYAKVRRLAEEPEYTP